MQSIRIAVRQLGIPSQTLDIYSPEQVEQELAFRYPDYTLQNTHYLGEVKDQQNNVLGWKVMFIFVRNEIPPQPSRESVVDAPKKGKAAKSE